MILHMRHWHFGLFLIPLLWFASAQTNTTNLDRVIATVDQHPILERDVRREVMIDRVLEWGLCPKFEQFPSLLLQSSRAFTAQKLIEEQAMKIALQNIAIDETLVKFEIKNYQALVSNVQNFQDYLKCTSDSMENIEQKIRLKLALATKNKQDLQTITPNDAEIAQFYNTHKYYYSITPRIEARMIVLPNRVMAAKVLESTRKGADFATLARQYSLVGASEDGALGAQKNIKTPVPVEKSDLSYKIPAILIKELFQMTDGKLSPIVSSSKKHYLVKVERYYPPRFNSLAEIYTKIKKEAKKAKLRELIEQHQESIMKQVDIKILDIDFNPIVARVNNENLRLSDLSVNAFFYEFDRKKLTGLLHEKIKKTAQIQGLKAENFQSIGNKQDQVDDFLRSRFDAVKIKDADTLSFYKTHISQYQESRRANEFMLFFKNSKLANAFRTQGLLVGDVPKTNTGFFETENFGPSGLSGTRSSQNLEMYSPPVQKNSENWSVHFIFFPVLAFTRTYQSVKDSIYLQLATKQRDEIGQRWIKKQLAEAKIESLLSNVISTLEKRANPW
jgi:parvulin-like peptidyl-prolyl isomerase